MQQYRERIYASYTNNMYASLNKLDEAGYQSYAKNMLRIYGRFLPTERHAEILDAGCGTGQFLYALKTAGYTNCLGTDISQEQVNVAKAFKQNAVCANSLEFLRKKKEQYDVILAKDFVEHLLKDEVIELISSAYKALKPGGTFICTVPNANSPFAARLHYKDFTHEQIFTHESLRQIFIACGLTPTYIIGEVHVPSTLKGWIRFAIARAIRFSWRVFMVSELGRLALRMPLEANLIGVARKET